MTLNGLVALTLRYFTKFVYYVVVKQLLGLRRFQNLLLIAYNHISMICEIIQPLFVQNKTPMSPGEFLVPAGRPILSSTAGWIDQSTLTMAD